MTSIKDWKPQETTFRWPTKSNGTRKFVFINKNDKENKIELQLANPEKSSEYLWQPFDVSQPMNPTGENDRLTVEVAVDDSVVEQFQTFDQACIDFATRESVKCFGKEISADAVKDRFTSPCRPSTGAGKSNLLRCKISADRVNVLRYVEFDEEQGKLRCKRGDLGLLTRGCHVAPKVDIMSLWFMAGDKQFGYSLQISDIIVDSSAGGDVASKPPFVMKEGIKLEVISDDDEAPSQPKTAEEPPAKRPATMAAGGIDASLEGTVNPNAYL